MYEKKFVLEINTEKSNEVHIWLNFLTAAKIHHKHHVMLIISIRCAFVGSSRIVQNKAAVRSSTARLHGFAARVQFQNSKFQKKNSAPAWRLKSRRNKKRIATVICKWRDESNEPN